MFIEYVNRFIRFDNDPEATEDLGPEVTHAYALTNLGRHTVGNMKVAILWPLQVT